MSQFADFPIPAAILQNLADKKYLTPTEVQEKAIPEIFKKVDVVIQSKTGSGKTAAFGVPLIASVKADIPAVQFVVLVPTRELAYQVFEELKAIAKDTPAKVCAIYGGASMNDQIQALRNGAQIVIGTPGRILDHLKRRTMSFSVVRGIVLDEADKMLSMGFLPDVQLIFKYLPKRRQVVMSSATFPFSVERIIEQYMDQPIRIEAASGDMSPSEIENLYCILPGSEKEQALLAFMEKEQPESSLIFCNTKVEVRSLRLFLTTAGINCEEMSSDLSQSQRERTLHKLRTGGVQHLVCTDLAARGIDIPDLSHVFIFSTSGDPETFVHRSGRTGRAGKSGKSISLVSSLDLGSFRQALLTSSVKITEIQRPTEEEILFARLNKWKKQLEGIEYGRDADVRDEFLKLAEQLDVEQAKSLLPILLEHFLRPPVRVEEDAPIVIAEGPEPSGSAAPYDHKPEEGRGGRKRERRRGRDRGPREGGRHEERSGPPPAARESERPAPVAASAPVSQAPQASSAAEDNGAREPRDARTAREGDRNDLRHRNQGREGREARDGKPGRDGRDERGGRNGRGERNDRGDRGQNRDSRDARESKGGRDGRDLRQDRDLRENREPQPVPAAYTAPAAPSREVGGSKGRFEKVCLALGRLDGMDEMDIQNLLRRLGRARMEDIGDIQMKDHESLIQIGSDSLRSVLQADGKLFKNQEIYLVQAKG